MQTTSMVEHWIYASYMAARPYLTKTLDAYVRRPEFTRHILNHLGSPDKAAYNVLVTGSKGKGSTSVMLAELLRAHGWKVGLFTSPHLVRFTERIRLNGAEILEDAFVRLGNKVKEVVDPLRSCLRPHEYVGPVGLAAVIAALYFREQKTDINIWECGRGALYDDVNQLTHQGSVITPIMAEHLTYLGPQLLDVVKHKLGVVTPSVHFVCIGRQDEHVQQTIQNHTSAWQGKKIVRLNREVQVLPARSDLEGTQFSVRTPAGYYDRLHVPLLGTFQADNAAVALAAAEQCINRLNTKHQSYAGRRSKPTRLHVSSVRRALGHVEWPGRLELLSRKPTVIVDGAIHRDSAEHIVKILPHMSKNAGILIIGIPRDKDYVGVLHVLAPLARKVIVTAANHDYLKFPQDASDVAKRFCTQVEFKAQAVAAFQMGLNQLGSDEWLAIVGTQSLVGEAQKFFKEQR